MRWVLLVLLALSCGPGLRKPAPAEAPPFPKPWTSPPPTLTFAKPATNYNERIKQPELNALSERILAQVQLSSAAAGRTPPIADERLFLAMAALASVVPRDGLIPYSLVEFALHSNGLIEPSPQIFVVWGPVLDPAGGGIPDEIRPVLDQIFAAGEMRTVGIGAVARDSSGDGAVVIALQADQVPTEPFPRKLALDQKAPLDVLVPRSTNVDVLVLRASGAIELVPVVASDTSATGEIDCKGATGQIFVEIMTNNESRAKFPIWCGLEPPRTYVVDERPKDRTSDAAAAERELVDLLNKERADMSLPPLDWNDQLALLAREHSEGMNSAGAVTYTLPSGSLKQQIVKRFGWGRAAAQIARAYGIGEVHRGFTELPSTRLPLVLPSTTQAGIGVAYGKQIVYGLREMYVTYIVAPD